MTSTNTITQPNSALGHRATLVYDRAAVWQGAPREARDATGHEKGPNQNGLRLSMGPFHHDAAAHSPNHRINGPEEENDAGCRQRH